MPLYEYECATCGRRTEVIQRVGAPPIGACAECGGEMKRLISAPAFQFKGEGWYVTDYARKGGPSSGGEGKAAEGDGKAADSSGKSSDSGGKPAESSGKPNSGSSNGKSS